MSLSLVPELLVSSALLGLLYAAAALGLSVTMGVLRIFNVTHGIFIVITGLLMWRLAAAGVPVVLIVILAAVLFFAGGMGIDWVLRQSDAEDNYGGLLILFGLMIVMESSAAMIWGTEQRIVRVEWLSSVIDFGFMRISSARLAAVVLALAGIIGLYLFLERSMTGKAIRAIAQDREAARVVGIPVGRISSLVFGIGTALAAIGGSSLALVFSFAPQTHFRWLVWAILIVVLGGMGSIKGTILAAFAVGAIESFGGALIRFQYIQLLIYGLLVLLLFVRSEGMASHSERRV